MLPVNRY